MYTLRILPIVVSLLISLILSACVHNTSTPETEKLLDHSPRDPWEPVNRGVYAFNDGLDRVTLRPVAKGYRKFVPNFVRRSVSNFFANMRTPLTIVNQALQGKGHAALNDTGRLLLNSTVGIGGLFDPAASLGLEEHNEDFGQTLATWGVPDGPFVTLPLLGPRTLRDALTIPLDLIAQPLYHYENASARDKLWVLEAISVRTQLLVAEKLIEDSSDPYTTIRNAYRQNRRYLIYDGEPPDDYDDLFDEYPEEEPTATD